MTETKVSVKPTERPWEIATVGNPVVVAGYVVKTLEIVSEESAEWIAQVRTRADAELLCAAVNSYSPAPPDKQDAAHESLPKLMAGHEWREISAASRSRINEYAASVEKLVEAAREAIKLFDVERDWGEVIALREALAPFDQG